MFRLRKDNHCITRIVIVVLYCEILEEATRNHRFHLPSYPRIDPVNFIWAFWDEFEWTAFAAPCQRNG